MGKRVLITGGAGYLGSILAERLLAEGHAVTVLDNLMYGAASLFHLASHPGFTFVRGDCRDEHTLTPLLAACEVVVPLAAIVGAPACDQDPQLAVSVNFEAIQLLLRLRRADQLVIYPNTNSGYGTRTTVEFCTEDAPLEPISLYGRTKVDAELALLARPNVITLRLATVFGASPRMRLDLLLNHFVYAALTDRYLVMFEQDFKRNFIHIRDVADCFVHCIAHADKMVGRAFNLGLDAANVSKAEVAELVQRHVPGFYIHYAEVGQDPDKRNYVVSNQRLREAGFEAKRGLEDGVRELIQAYAMLGRAAMKNV